MVDSGGIRTMALAVSAPLALMRQSEVGMTAALKARCKKLWQAGTKISVQLSPVCRQSCRSEWLAEKKAKYHESRLTPVMPISIVSTQRDIVHSEILLCDNGLSARGIAVRDLVQRKGPGIVNLALDSAIAPQFSSRPLKCQATSW